jgi:arginyl-tRNA synthetase
MFLDFKKEVEDALKTALKKLELKSDSLETELSEHADLASKVAFRLDRKNPAALAKKICDALPKGNLFSHTEAKGPYINFLASGIFLEHAVEKILREREGYGSLHNEGRVIIEHTSANPDGPLHVGHLRNAVIGDTLARVMRRAGYSVETQYYVNDMGRQIAVAVWGAGRFPLDKNKKGDNAVVDVYIAANRALESGGESEVEKLMQDYQSQKRGVTERFKELVDTCLGGIRATLQRINVEHDAYVNESKFALAPELGGLGNKTVDALSRLKKSQYAEMKDGAFVLDMKDFGMEKELFLVRSDGTTLYAARDLAYHIWKGERCDMMIDVLGADHKLHAAQISVTLKNILNSKPPEVVIFEFVSLPTGSMSTRAGKYIAADELLDKVEAEALKEVEKRREYDEKFKKEVARTVSVGAIRYDMIKVSPEKAMTFDWKSALDFEKQSAPFIQYSHARACSILRKADEKIEGSGISLLKGAGEVNLIKKLSQFSMFIDEAASGLRPYTIAIYAREVAETFNAFYRDYPVLEAPPEVRKARLALVECTKIVLKNALEVLGIGAPEMM